VSIIIIVVQARAVEIDVAAVEAALRQKGKTG
jgi:hypothetical protein